MRTILLGIVCATALQSQPQTNTLSGSCNQIVNANKGVITITCKGVDKDVLEQLQRTATLLDRIASRQADPKIMVGLKDLNSKLDGILSDTRELKATVAQTNQQLAAEQKQAEQALKAITGGDSFCYMHLQVSQDGLYPVVLSVGQYPLYDLSVRLWDPEEWKGAEMSHAAVLSRVASETTQLGTLPTNDYKNIGRIPLPTGAHKEYAVQFSARNGSWSQTLMLRRSPQGWKVASLVQQSRRVSTFAELNQSLPKLCYEADPDFPEREPQELKQWIQDTPRCKAGSHP